VKAILEFDLSDEEDELHTAVKGAKEGCGCRGFEKWTSRATKFVRGIGHGEE
jgi:hypothetical protein